MTAPATYHINTSPRTEADCLDELARLGDLRELGRLTDAEYYPLDGALIGWLAEFQEAERLADLVTLNPAGAAERMEGRHLGRLTFAEFYEVEMPAWDAERAEVG